MKIIGITGGIASGKSTVTKILRKRFNFIVLDADQWAREVVLPRSLGLKKIEEVFGKAYLLKSGELNRDLLGKTIAENDEAKKKLNAIVHPEIKKIYDKEVAMYKKMGMPMVFYDCPLLFESGLEKTVDEIFLIVANQSLRIQRMIQRDGISFELAEKKIQMQMSDAEKIKKSDVIIENNGTPEDLLITLNTYLSFRKLWVKKLI